MVVCCAISGILRTVDVCLGCSCVVGRIKVAEAEMAFAKFVLDGLVKFGRNVLRRENLRGLVLRSRFVRRRVVSEVEMRLTKSVRAEVRP